MIRRERVRLKNSEYRLCIAVCLQAGVDSIDPHASIGRSLDRHHQQAKQVISVAGS
jgi:hypothetical protein